MVLTLKTDTLSNGIKLKHKYAYIQIPGFSIRKPEIDTGIKKTISSTNGASQTRWLHVEERQ